MPGGARRKALKPGAPSPLGAALADRVAERRRLLLAYQNAESPQAAAFFRMQLDAFVPVRRG